MGTILGREPVLVMVAVQALIGVGIAFGLSLSADQVTAVMAGSAAVLGLIVRQRVSPTIPPAQ
jgi:hypothetical protein